MPAGPSAGCPTRCGNACPRPAPSRPDSACGVTSSSTSTSTSPARATSTTREVFACPIRRFVVITCSRCVPAASAAGVPRYGPLAQNACSSRPSSEATTSSLDVPRQNRWPRHQAGSRSSSAAAYSSTAYGVKETSRTQGPPGRSSRRAVVSSPAGTRRTVTSRPSSSHRSFMRPTLGGRGSPTSHLAGSVRFVPLCPGPVLLVPLAPSVLPRARHASSTKRRDRHPRTGSESRRAGRPF